MVGPTGPTVRERVGDRKSQCCSMGAPSGHQEATGNYSGAHKGLCRSPASLASTPCHWGLLLPFLILMFCCILGRCLESSRHRCRARCGSVLSGDRRSRRSPCVSSAPANCRQAQRNSATQQIPIFNSVLRSITYIRLSHYASASLDVGRQARRAAKPVHRRDRLHSAHAGANSSPSADRTGRSARSII